MIEMFVPDLSRFASGIIAAGQAPPIGWIAPFALLLLCIAILPLTRRASHWWEHNRNKLLVGLLLGAAALWHYQSRPFGVLLHNDVLVRAMSAAGVPLTHAHGHTATPPGLPAALGALGNAMMEYLPFILFLFSLYCISGGIVLRGDLPAHPVTNTAFLVIGGLAANLIGTTGASMLLIRPLLQTNSERRHVVHTVIFFIFIVSNVGGSLLPFGDPPLFLGFLRGVPFLWTLHLALPWACMMSALLLIYYLWDCRVYATETLRDVARDEQALQKLRLLGSVNFLWLAGVTAAVVLLDAKKTMPGTNWTPPSFLREAVMLALVGASFLTTPRGLRHASGFNFVAIGEVACLFVGLFITMQIPLEILQARGAELGLTKPWHFFWMTGILSSFLDNAPTYLVFFETANAMTQDAGPGITPLLDGRYIRQDLLEAISLGAVFMGANTYIGNGPNFMVKSIAVQSGVKMPGFFGYMLYSGSILIPLFLLITLMLK